MTENRQHDLPCLYLAGEVVRALHHIVLSARHGRELCGLLSGPTVKGTACIATAVHPLTNVSKLPACFAVDVAEMLASQAGMTSATHTPIAIYHTHPSGSLAPSFSDTRLPTITGLYSVIAAAQHGRLRTACHAVLGTTFTSINVRRLVRLWI